MSTKEVAAPETGRTNTENQADEIAELSPSKQVRDDKEESGKGEPALKRKQTSEQLQAELTKGGFFGKNCDWISFSLLAGLTMGTGSFLYASNYADLGFEGGGLCGPFVFIIFLFVWIIR